MKIRQKCVNLIVMSKLSKYVVFFLCAFAYGPLFDLCLLLLDVLVLPQKLFAKTKCFTIRKRGRPLIHEGIMYFPCISPVLVIFTLFLG